MNRIAFFTLITLVLLCKASFSKPMTEIRMKDFNQTGFA